MHKFIIPCLALLFAGNLAAQQARVGLSVCVNHPTHEITFKGKTVVASSPLGMNFDNVPLGENVALGTPDVRRRLPCQD